MNTILRYMKHLWCFSIARGFLKKETSSWLVWKPCISGGCNKAVWFFPLQRQRELMKELSGFTVWKCIHFFLIVWIICLKEEATQSFVLLFSWSHLTLQFENAWNNIQGASKKTEFKRDQLSRTQDISKKIWPFKNANIVCSN